MNISYPILLDGGLSNQLEKQQCNLADTLWTARLLDTNPEAIIRAHVAYLEAGAQCITTASYQASIPGFLAAGYSETTAEELLRRSVQLAEEAVSRVQASIKIKSKPLIAASIGPYGAYLADGSEYTGVYDITEDELSTFHRTRLDILDKTNADFFACETIPSFLETQVLAKLLMKTHKKAWISFSCQDDEHLHDGTNIQDCVSFLDKHPNIFAVGVNCTAPQHISGLIRLIKSTGTSKRIIVYPNSGEAYHVESKTWLGTSEPASFSELAKTWQVLGADIIGGCCRIGPKHIQQLSSVLTR